MEENRELKTINIDLKPIEDLVTSVQTLKTLTETQNWKMEALVQVEKIKNYCNYSSITILESIQ